MFNPREIKMCIFDLDGTLTDGHYIVSDTGSISKSFFSTDFYSLQQLQSHGIYVMILTHSNDEVIDRKIENLPDIVKHKLILVKIPLEVSKVIGFQEWNMAEAEKIFGRRLNGQEITFMGDAENDLDLLQMVCWGGCPSDAVSIIKENVNYIADRRGGYGAVHAFAMDLLRMREEYDTSD